MKFPVPEAITWHETTVDGMLRSVLIAYVLWSLFWLQLVISRALCVSFCWVNSKSLSLHYEVPGYFFTVAEFLLGISITFGAVAMVITWIETKKSKAKWRQRFLVALFSIFPIGWAWLQFPSRDYQLDQAVMILKSLEAEEDPRMRRMNESQVRDLRKVLVTFGANEE